MKLSFYCLLVVLALKLVSAAAKKGSKKSEAQGSNTASRGALGQGFEIHRIDLLTKQLQATGTTIFDNLDYDECTTTDRLGATSKDDTFFSSTESLYSSVSINTNIDASIKGTYTLGASVVALTNNIVAGNKEVNGLSLNLKAQSLSHELKADCINEQALSSRFVEDFEALEKEITDPWNSRSWIHYQAFLEKYGSHFVKGVVSGSSIYQYVFAEKSDSFSQRDLTVKACISLAGPSQVGKVGLSACAGVSQQEIESSSSQSVVSKLVARGGTPETRAEIAAGLLNEDQINTFLQEAETHPLPIKYTFYSIWKLLKIRYISTEHFAKALNLEQYYKGYLSYGCEKQRSTNDVVDLQKFELKGNSNPDAPTYVCTLSPTGCHEDDDCHLKPVAWCSCYGQSCIRHSEKILQDTGTIKTFAHAHMASGWSGEGCTGEGGFFSCKCSDPRTTRVESWSGETDLQDIHLALIKKKRRDEAQKTSKRQHHVKRN